MSPTEIRVEQPWLHARPYHAEGVIWFADSLWFVDINRGRVFRFHGSSAALSWFEVPGMVGAIHPASDGSLVVADADGALLCTPAGEVIRRLAAPLADQADIRMNDGNVDPAGRYLIGSTALDFRAGAGSLWRLDPDGSLHTLLTGATVSNGLDWSPDGTLLYYVDTPLRRVDVFAYDVATGARADRRPFVDTSALPGLPDGLTVDAAGGVWVAFYQGGRVCRFTPEGALDVIITLPVPLVTSCCFGGPALDQLFISTSTENLTEEQVAATPAAGAIFVARPGVTGRAPTRYRLAP